MQNHIWLHANSGNGEMIKIICEVDGPVSFYLKVFFLQNTRNVYIHGKVW